MGKEQINWPNVPRRSAPGNSRRLRHHLRREGNLATAYAFPFPLRTSSHSRISILSPENFVALGKGRRCGLGVHRTTPSMSWPATAGHPAATDLRFAIEKSLLLTFACGSISSGRPAVAGRDKSGVAVLRWCFVAARVRTRAHRHVEKRGTKLWGALARPGTCWPRWPPRSRNCRERTGR
jgi:hypothetical protein